VGLILRFNGLIILNGGESIVEDPGSLGLFLSFLVFVGPGCMIFLLLREEYYEVFGSTEEEDVDKMADHFTSENPLHGSGGEAEFPTLVLEDGIELTFNKAYNMSATAKGDADDGGEVRRQSLRRSLTAFDVGDDGGESRRRSIRSSIADGGGGTPTPTAVEWSVENPLHATLDVEVSVDASVDVEEVEEVEEGEEGDGAAAAEKEEQSWERRFPGLPSFADSDELGGGLRRSLTSVPTNMGPRSHGLGVRAVEDFADVAGLADVVEVEVVESESEDEAQADSEWVEVETDDGRTYYHNTVTDETSWTRPESLAKGAASAQARPRGPPSSDKNKNKNKPKQRGSLRRNQSMDVMTMRAELKNMPTSLVVKGEGGAGNSFEL